MIRLLQLTLIACLLMACDAPTSGETPQDTQTSETLQPDTAPPEVPSASFFEPDTLQDIELLITEEDRAAMLDALPERIYVPATFLWRDIPLENVGVRFKGNSSSNPGTTWKRSYLIKMDEYVPGQRFLGLRRVALDNAIQFGSLFSERIISDILRAEGVIVSRSNYARLILNGEPAGLYVNVERIDRAFLSHHFPDNPRGTLLKVHEGGPGADLALLERPEDYAHAFDHKAGPNTLDELQRLTALLAHTPDDALPEALEAQLELEPFLKLMAVAVLSGAFDQYTGWNPHNYYLYHHPNTRRWHYLVWDLDVGFADNAFGQIPVIDGWNASYPLPRQPRPLLARILAHPQLRERYRAHAERILEQYFRPEDLHARLDALYTFIEPALTEDPFPPVRITNPSDTDYESIIASMKDFMTLRYTRAREELDNPTHTPPNPPPENEGPSPGAEPTSQDPSELTVTGIDASGVHLTWTDNAAGEAAHVLQRCQGEGCTDFANHLGFPGEDISAATDPAIGPGRTFRYRVYAVFPTPQGPEGSGVSNVAEARVP